MQKQRRKERCVCICVCACTCVRGWGVRAYERGLGRGRERGRESKPTDRQTQTDRIPPPARVPGENPAPVTHPNTVHIRACKCSRVLPGATHVRPHSNGYAQPPISGDLGVTKPSTPISRLQTTNNKHRES